MPETDYCSYHTCHADDDDTEGGDYSESVSDDVTQKVESFWEDISIDDRRQ